MSGALGTLRKLVANQMGGFQARRLERAADEVPGLDRLYSEQALRDAFVGDNSDMFAVMRPGDFERYASPLVPETPGSGAYFRAPGKSAEKNVYGSIPPGWERLPRSAYIDQLRGYLGPGRGFRDVPYLNLRETTGSLTPPPLAPYPKGSESFDAYITSQIAREKFAEDFAAGRLPTQPLAVTGHEGRHRMRALDALGQPAALVRLMPTGVTRERLSRTSPDSFLDEFRVRYGVDPLVSPERAWDTSGPKMREVERDPVRLPRPFSAGGVARKAAGALSEFLRDSKTPQRLYHGTRATEKGGDALATMRPSREGSLGSGVYMTPDPARASAYADGAGGYVLPLHARLLNPLTIDGSLHVDPMVEALVRLGTPVERAQSLVERAYEQRGYIGRQVETRARAAGHDGLMQMRDGRLSEVVAYDPASVKSATGNEGTFSTSDRRLSKAGGGLVRRGAGALASVARAEEPRGSVRLGEREIPVTMHPIDERSGAQLVSVRTQPFDDAWKRSGEGFYVGPQGAGGIEGRYERFADFIREAPSMRASNVYVSPKGGVMFGDGRHRFSYLRDNGAQSIPVAMDRDAIENARRFGLID